MNKRSILALVVCMAMVLASCGSSAGSPAQVSQEAGTGQTSGQMKAEESTATENEEAAAENQGAGAENQGAAAESGKPDLVIMGKEDTDYNRAAQNKRVAEMDVKVSALHASTELPVIADKDYTVMVYIVGSNLESRYGAATNDLNEMIGAGIDYNKVNLLVYTGGSKRWNSDISNTYNSVLNMADGESLQVAAKTGETADMGTPQTLADFINYCTTNFPARHYGLVLWDHGAGPLWGYGSDELFSNDSLLLDELKTAMDQTAFGGSQKLDWVGFDACLMGSIENANLWKDYAKYLVGSEELEPGRGWDYSFLSTLNSTDDAKKIVSSIVDSYGRYYEENRSEFFNPDITLAAMDLSALGDAVKSVNALFDVMSEGIEEGEYAALNRARGKTKAFGLSVSGTREGAYDLLDLRNLAENLKDLYPGECADVTASLDRMIVRSTANVSGAGGVSIYLPGDNQELYSVSGQLYTAEASLSEPYREFVDAYMDAWTEGVNTDWGFEKIEQGDGELTLQLTEEQVRNASLIHYSVLQRNSFGDYAITTGRVAIEPDENNILHIPGDPMILAAVTDMENYAVPLTCTQIESGEEESVYRTIGTYLTPGHEFKDVDINQDESVVITAKNRNGEREAQILDITSSAGSAGAGGKESVDVSNFDSVVNAGSISLSPGRDEEGRLKPFHEWEASGYEMYPMSLDRGFKTVMKPISEFNHSFICQVVVKDVNGNQHGTEYFEYSFDKDKHVEEIETPGGTLYAEVTEEGAEITEYEGTDEILEIPDSAGGKPVTRIADNAFASKKTLKEVVLPDTVTEIGSEAFFADSELTKIVLPGNLKTIGISAFRRSGLSEIEIPQSVESIGRAAFADTALSSVTLPDQIRSIGSMPFSCCRELKEIKLSGDNPAYKTVNGVLYTKDGKLLVQYPCAAGGEYRVEEGTEEIGYGAFADAVIEGVIFPESLKTIGNMAFYECLDLRSLDLPDSLETIGDTAFGYYYILAYGKTMPRMDSIHIGPNVKYIGSGAFNMIDTAVIEVDEANEQFASVGGFVTSKAKDVITYVPAGMRSPIVIPDGITTLQDELFAEMDIETEFVIPDSTFRMGERVFPCKYGERDEEGNMTRIYNIRIHCSEGSAAEKYAHMYEIPCDNETDPEELRYEEVTEEVPETEESQAQTRVWNVYKNRAELVKLAAEDSGTITIPSEYNGLPVTALKFKQSVTDSESTRAIRVVIPDTVQKIDWEFFGTWYYLQELEVDENNSAYVSIDSVLFTKDQETLVGYPQKKADPEYEVPGDVETISKKAFYMNPLIGKVTFPRSLRTIGDHAFCSCTALKEAVFAKGLKKIESWAFNSAKLQNVELPSTVTEIGNSVFTVTETFGEIVLPEKLEKLGYNAFATPYGESFSQDSLRIPAKLRVSDKIMRGVLLGRYEVDEKNPYHSEANGALMSKDGKTLITVPTQAEGDFTVPEGTLYIRYGAFDECDQITDVYLPESLLDIGDIYKKDYETGEYYYVIHCHEGTEAQKVLDARKVPWTAIE